MSAQDRGWGAPPAPRTLMVNLRAGRDGVQFPGGVHRDIVPLVKELVRRIESQTGEHAVEGYCWGYAARKIRGGSSWSNHAWGLAIDFNAPHHPLGSEGTWDGKHEVLSSIAQSLGFRWGGDYGGRKDEMHFEFMGTPQDAQRRIENLGLDTTSEGEENMLQRGDSGNAVAVFQKALQTWRSEALPEFGADADFGGETEEWVKKYQKAADISPTGRIDGVTAALLSRYVAMSASTPSPAGTHTHAIVADPALSVAGSDALGKELAKSLSVTGTLHAKENS